MLMSAAKSALQLADGRAVRHGGALRASPHQVGNAGAQWPLLGKQGAPANDDLGVDAEQPANRGRPAPNAIDRARDQQNRFRRATETVTPATEPLQPISEAHATEFDRELCEHFAREMLTFHPDQLAYVRDQSPTIDVAALEEALANVMRYDGQLRAQLQQAKTGLEQSIEAARDSFDGFVTGPADAPARLNLLADTLKKMTALMVLMPGQAYGNIIQKMATALDSDHAAGQLDAYQSAQRDLLRRHMSELSQADRSPDHWGTIIQSLNAFGRGMATLAANADQRPAGRA